MIVEVILVILLALWFFLIFPAKNISTARFFFQKYTLFAHRGLFDQKKAPENSLRAFRRAIDAGFGIELDVHMTADGKLMVFHDDNLQRMCKDSRSIEQMTAAEVQTMQLLDSDQHIPYFTDVLALVGGKVPLIVEIKGSNTNALICKKTAKILDIYKGEYCIESFNPFYVAWFRKNRPQVIRGQLSCRMKKGKSFSEGLRNFALQRLFFNVISRPHFIAFCHKDKNLCNFRLCRSMGAIPVAWTITSEKELSSAKKIFTSYIFEQFVPPQEK